MADKKIDNEEQAKVLDCYVGKTIVEAVLLLGILAVIVLRHLV